MQVVEHTGAPVSVGQLGEEFFELDVPEARQAPKVEF